MPTSESTAKADSDPEVETADADGEQVLADLAAVEIPAPGTDPDSIEAAAKHQLAAADPTHDDRARDDLNRAARGRALVAERNGAGPERVAAIDEELAKLGFDAPLPTTIAQRGDTQAPLGRQAPGPDATAEASQPKATASGVDDGKPSGKPAASAKADGKADDTAADGGKSPAAKDAPKK